MLGEDKERAVCVAYKGADVTYHYAPLSKSRPLLSNHGGDFIPFDETFVLL